MNILIPTDSFPPVCGGSGWSTFELARGLRARGHRVLIVQPLPGTTPGARETVYDGFRVIEFGAAAPDLPYVRNYFKNERLYRALTTFLASVIARERIELVHAQHVMTSVPAVAAAQHPAAEKRVPVVCTVRDYWPVCYWSDLIHAADQSDLCPGCSATMMGRCIQPRAGALWPLALPLIPYMRANLSRKRRGLAAADAVVAVSSTLASDLRARAPELAGTRMEVIPNPVDIADLRARAMASPAPIEEPYALYVGKLAANKGTSHLVRVVEEAQLDWPLVVAGDGPERALLQSQAARSAHDIRLLGWVDQNQTAALLAHASMLIFPSKGPESLSRVLIEASALGVPIAAMNTGGTSDIIAPGESGLLSNDPRELASDVRRLRGDDALRKRLAAAARSRAEARFEASAVVDRVEDLYRELLVRHP
jgi:glycosyltransferase involved in cell wall biosynthesis